jgi:phage terminase large subunit-like protein
MSALVLEDGRRWGEAATTVQREDASAILDPASATPYSFLTRSRGYSKTSDLGGVTSVAMLAQLPPRSRLYALAADRDQGRLLVDAVAGYVARTPELRGALEVGSYRVTAPRSGSVLEVLAADAPSAWGLKPAFLVVDELAAWESTAGPRRVWEATSSAVAKMAGTRLVVLTTAGDPAHWSRKVLDHALSDPLWRVHEVPGPAPWLDPARLEEQRRRLRPSVYARLFENVWTASEDRLVSAEDLRACVTLDGPLEPDPRHRYVIGVDIGLKRDRTAVAVCHREGAVVVLDRLAVWSGSRIRPVKLTEVEEYLLDVSRRYRASVILDPYQAVGLMQRLRACNVTAREYVFAPQSVGRLASTLFTLLHERNLRLPDDEELLDELANVRLRETSPGVVRMDHDPDRHDDRAVAVALAATSLVKQADERIVMRVYSPVKYRIPTQHDRFSGGVVSRSTREWLGVE